MHKLLFIINIYEAWKCIVEPILVHSFMTIIVVAFFPISLQIYFLQQFITNSFF
jgi:hypothetical protein